MADKWIHCGNPGDCVFVSDYEPGHVWLSVQIGRASAAVVLTPQETQALIDALQRQMQEAQAEAA